jgi:hypothetical protein
MVSTCLSLGVIACVRIYPYHSVCVRVCVRVRVCVCVWLRVWVKRGSECFYQTPNPAPRCTAGRDPHTPRTQPTTTKRVYVTPVLERHGLFKAVQTSRRTFRWGLALGGVVALQKGTTPWGEVYQSHFVTSKVLSMTFACIDHLKMLQILGQSSARGRRILWLVFLTWYGCRCAAQMDEHTLTCNTVTDYSCRCTRGALSLSPRQGGYRARWN